MAEIVKTMKLHIHLNESDIPVVQELTEAYRNACNFVSDYIFGNGFPLSYGKLHSLLYHDLREVYHLKSQMAQSCIKTVIARYKTVQKQLKKTPYRFNCEDGGTIYFERNLEWSWKPIHFSRPQADLVRGRDYSFVKEGAFLSLNTLGRRIKVSFDIPDCFRSYFEEDWKFGTGKIVNLRGQWYFHIPMTKRSCEDFSKEHVKHVVGIDRGLRFLMTTYDEKGDTFFYDGKSIMEKREHFQEVRSELQAKGTRSAKRALKRISGRENRWMTDENHQLSKTLVEKYGTDTLFVLEDLVNVSLSESNLHRSKKNKRELRSWAFYQLGQFLTYKAQAVGSEVLEVKPDYTSQRCPKCGRIHKLNRHHEIHEYICDCCGYRSNDDRIAAMNIQLLGTMYISGNPDPCFIKETN